MRLCRGATGALSCGTGCRCMACRAACTWRKTAWRGCTLSCWRGRHRRMSVAWLLLPTTTLRAGQGLLVVRRVVALQDANVSKKSSINSTRHRVSGTRLCCSYLKINTMSMYQGTRPPPFQTRLQRQFLQLFRSTDGTDRIDSSLDASRSTVLIERGRSTTLFFFS